VVSGSREFGGEREPRVGLGSGDVAISRSGTHSSGLFVKCREIGRLVLRERDGR
jgi:hypothetical protein